MCLVSVCPKGTVKYSDEVEAFIRQGASSNRSGSGFMYKRDGENTITIHKGFFKVDDLLNKLKECNLKEEDELVIHHRIPTSGNENDENTHPFVCSDIHEEVCAVNITINKPCMAHNGMFSIYKLMQRNPEYSDTYAFARYIMGDKNVMGLFRDNREMFDACFDKVIGYNKIAILFPDRDVEMVGNFTEDNGYYHSNGGYKSYVRNIGGKESKSESEVSCSVNLPSVKGKFEGITSSNSDVFNNYNLHSNLNADGSLFRLTPIHITIDYLNFKHFVYIKKDDYINGKINNKTIFKFNDFNLNHPIQSGEYKEDKFYTYKTITTHELLNDCYYIPVGAYNSVVYRDYVKLFELAEIPTKTGCKKLSKLISSKHRLNGNDTIDYKGRKYCKASLYLHLKDMEEYVSVMSNRKTLPTALVDAESLIAAEAEVAD